MKSEQKERMLLGAIICKNELAHLLDGLAEDDFTTKEDRQIFNAMRRLKQEGKPIDPTFLTENASALLDYAVDLSKQGSLWNAQQYAQDLHELGEKRRLYKILKKSADELESTDIQDVLDQLRTRTQGMGANKADEVSMADIAARVFDQMETASRGGLPCIKTGLPVLDDIIGGMYCGELIIIGARPSVGKSAFGVSLAIAAASAGKKAFVCSCEMSDLQYGNRVLSSVTGMNSMLLRNGRLTGDQWQEVGDGCNKMSALDIGFTFRVKRVEDLYSLCLARREKHGLDILIVDYLQIMDTREHFENENIRITRISGKLKQLALDLGIPVIALAQVKRQDTPSMPTLSELRGSGSLEQDADKVIFLHRVESETDDFCRPKDAYSRITQSGKQFIAVNVAKHRDGKTSWFPVCFEPGRMRYSCIK